MRERRHEEDKVTQAVATAFAGLDRLVLAVSGGVDSMVMLHAAASIAPDRRPALLVASFDHGTGAVARRAVEAVRRTSKELGLAFRGGKTDRAVVTEHQWRLARWTFLRGAAEEFGAPVATGHTLDDQVETIFIRILRDAGPRGLAALFAESEVIRPFLHLRRADLARFARARQVVHVEDPSNSTRSHLRNRVRHDLLPAIARIRPGFPAQLLSIAKRSADWRSRMADIADQLDAETGEDGSLRIARGALRGYDAESLRALWPSLAARANVVMDRRGTHRLAEFTTKGVTGGSIQLSGGVEVLMLRDHMLLRRWDWRRVEAARASRLGAPAPRTASHAGRM